MVPVLLHSYIYTYFALKNNKKWRAKKKNNDHKSQEKRLLPETTKETSIKPHQTPSTQSLHPRAPLPSSPYSSSSSSSSSSFYVSSSSSEETEQYSKNDKTFIQLEGSVRGDEESIELSAIPTFSVNPFGNKFVKEMP